MYYITPKCALTQEFRQKVPKTIRLREKKIFTNLAFAFTIIVYKVAYTNAIMTYKRRIL